MKILRADADVASPVHEYESRSASSALLGSGRGEARAWVLHLGEGGEVGPHEAGFDQLFIVAQGDGWGAGPDGLRRPLRVGQVALFRKGELHSKGSETGMIAIVLQVEKLDGD